MVYSRPPLDAVFGALADPTRRAIVARLAAGETTVGELARPFPMSLPAVGKHLSVLERAGLVERWRDGRVRRCRLSPAPLHDAADWLEPYRQLWTHHLDRLASYLGEPTPPEEAPPWPAPSDRPRSRSASTEPSAPRRSGSSRRGRRRRS